MTPEEKKDTLEERKQRIIEKEPREKQIATYDRLFKELMDNPTLIAFILKMAFPDFYPRDIAQLVTWIVRQSENVVTKLETEFYVCRHRLHADFLCLIRAQLPDARGNDVSQYRLNIEMQQKNTPADLPLDRELVYGFGLLTSYHAEKIYGLIPPVISIWIKPHMRKIMNCEFKAVEFTPNQEILTAFYENREGWYTVDTNKEQMKEARNRLVVHMIAIDFGWPAANPDLATRVFANLFFKPGNERDYAFLESLGLHFSEGEKETMDDLYARTNIFFEEGKEEGKEEGIEEGIGLGEQRMAEAMLAKAKAQGEEAYNFVYNLIHSPNPGQ